MAILQYLLQFKATDGDFAISDIYGDFAIISSFDHYFGSLGNLPLFP